MQERKKKKLSKKAKKTLIILFLLLVILVLGFVLILNGNKGNGKLTPKKTTTKTTTSNKVVPKMVLNKIQLYDKNLGLGTVNKKIGDKTYPVHEIKNEGQVNLTYNITKNVTNESKYYRKMYIYDDIILVISGSEVRNHDVLAQEWFYGLMPRPDMSIKVG